MGGVNFKKGRAEQEQNYSRNLKILPGIGRLGKFSRRFEVNMNLKFWDV